MKNPLLKRPTVSDDHPQHSTRRQVIVSALVFLLLISATAGVILYGKGYRIFVQEGEPKVTKTGILNLNSNPDGAAVFVNDRPNPTTSTNDKLDLTPGKYKIKIAKDGYHDWQKDFDIQREVVANANATLFPKAPTLQSISTLGIQSAFIDPTGTKLAFNIASNSARRNGIYVFDMTARAFPVLAGQSSATQIADDTVDIFSQAQLSWSPDGRQIMASISATPDGLPTYYLLAVDRLNEAPQDITATYTSTLELWEEQRSDKELARIKSLRPDLQKFSQQNFRVLSWSPDENKILYQASASAEMPVYRKPRLIGNNNLYERRDLEEGATYVYNIKEDVNTRVLEPMDKVCTNNADDCVCPPFTKCVSPITWFPDSGHLLYVNNKQIQVIEDDGSNLTTLYAGPFVEDYVYPWPDGSKIVMLTNFNNMGVAPTLYSIGLK
jgi:dipeptidyl aminopeptidase/acylaminoacyl peptidase